MNGPQRPLRVRILNPRPRVTEQAQLLWGELKRKVVGSPTSYPKLPLCSGGPTKQPRTPLQCLSQHGRCPRSREYDWPAAEEAAGDWFPQQKEVPSASPCNVWVPVPRERAPTQQPKVSLCPLGRPSQCVCLCPPGFSLLIPHSLNRVHTFFLDTVIFCFCLSILR